jgi:superoxide dismutase, Cu-Zn family
VFRLAAAPPEEARAVGPTHEREGPAESGSRQRADLRRAVAARLWALRCLAALVTGCVLLGLGVLSSSGAAAQPGASAVAEVRDPTGRIVLNAEFREGSGEVSVRITVPDPPPVMTNTHGLHIHETGRCDPPDFRTAGAIFNPSGKAHGLQNPSGPMLGDLPNLQLDVAAAAGYTATLTGATLGSGASALLDTDGSALVLFRGGDDGRSQPEGNAGGRIACGIIVARGQSPPVAARPTTLPTTVPRPTASAAAARANAVLSTPIAIAKPSPVAAPVSAASSTTTSTQAPRQLSAALVAGLGTVLLVVGIVLGRLSLRRGG